MAMTVLAGSLEQRQDEKNKILIGYLTGERKQIALSLSCVIRPLKFRYIVCDLVKIEAILMISELTDQTDDIIPFDAEIPTLSPNQMVKNQAH